LVAVSDHLRRWLSWIHVHPIWNLRTWHPQGVGGVFPKSVAYLGVATGAIGIVSEALQPVLGIAYAIYGVLVMVWFLVIGWQLYRLARDGEQAESWAS